MKLRYLISLILLLALFVGFIVIKNQPVHKPKQKFDYHKTYREFSIKADTVIGSWVDSVLDEVSFRLSDVLGYDEGAYDIFLCSKTSTYAHFANLVGRPGNTQGFNLQPLNHIYINLTFIQEIRKRNMAGYRYNILEGNLAHIIAHEICHQLIADEIGYLNMRTVEPWKLEGFCEYSASKRLKEMDTTYSFNQFASRFVQGRYNEIPAGRKFYIKSLLVTEYFLDHKGKDFETLMETKLTVDELLEEVELKIQQ